MAAVVALDASSDRWRDLRTVRVLWQREMLRLARNPLRIAMGLVTPLMFLLVLGTGLSAAGITEGFRQYRTFLFPGILLMAVQAPAMAAGISVVVDRQTGFLRQMLVAPVRRGALMTGICLGGATTGTAYGALVVLVAPAADVAYRPALLLVLLELAVIALAFTALGALAAVSIRRIETFQVVVSLCVMPLFFLSGAMFPADGLPGWLGIAVRVNPLTYAVDALRGTLLGDATLGGRMAGPQWWGWSPSPLVEMLVIGAVAVLLMVAATRRFARTS